MATTITKYNALGEWLADSVVDLEDAPANGIKLALVTSSYTFSAEHTLFDNGANDATDPSFNEVATGNGYTTGGEVLGSLAVTRSGATTTFDAADVTWTSLTKTFRAGILYLDATVDSIAKPLIAYILFDDTAGGTDVTINGVNFTVQWNASGIITIS